MRWLITGGCGFIGCNIVQYLLQQGQRDIRVIDNLQVCGSSSFEAICTAFPSKDEGAPQPTLLVGDITNPEDVAKAVEGVDIIVHLAADSGVIPSIENPKKNFMNNVLGTLEILEAVRKNPHIKMVVASTGAALGEQEPPVHEEMVPKPLSPYGAGKLACEGYCQGFAGSYGLHMTILRFSNVYGPHAMHKNSVIPKMLKTALARDTMVIYGDGGQTRDFLYVEDLVQAVILAAKSELQGEIIQLATNCETTIKELCGTADEMLRDTEFQKLQVEYGDARPGEIRRSFYDISKAKRLLGWEPAHSLQAGLNKTIQWFATQGGVPS